jgi:hypothetical protein
MDNTTLERLMIDDALGELSPDARELLQAFLHDRENELAQWRQLAADAKAALPLESVESLPAFPRQNILRFQPFLRAGLAAAAALLVGVGIGRQIAPRPTTEIVTIQTPAPTAASPTVATADSSDFWSSKRLLAVALDTERHAQPASHWDLNELHNLEGIR